MKNISVKLFRLRTARLAMHMRYSKYGFSECGNAIELSASQTNVDEYWAYEQVSSFSADIEGNTGFSTNPRDESDHIEGIIVYDKHHETSDRGNEISWHTRYMVHLLRDSPVWLPSRCMIEWCWHLFRIHKHTKLCIGDSINWRRPFSWWTTTSDDAS